MNKLVCLSSISTDDIKDKKHESLIAWIEKQAEEWQLDYLLAHAEDGVIWGQFDNSKLTTADEIFDKDFFGVDLPALRLSTLQQCRIFGEKGEILLWQTESGWESRLIQDDPEVDHIQEWQVLWGTQKETGENGGDGEKDGFTLLSDGSQELKHAVPLTGITFKQDRKKLYRPIRLLVHHYIDYDDSGIARIFLSRLVSLKAV